MSCQQAVIGTALFLSLIIIGSTGVRQEYMDDEEEFVTKILHNVSNIIKARILDEFVVQNVTFGLSIGFAELKTGSIGKLSSLVLRDVHQLTVTQSNSVKLYQFDLDLGLSDFRISAEVLYKIEELLAGSTLIEMLTTEDAVRLVGGVRIHLASGRCRAYLDNASIVELGSVKINLTPMTIVNSLLTYLAEGLTNHFSPTIIPYINYAIPTYIVRFNIPTVFSEVICSALKK
uniref:Uncharacterized protein n=1 Tax=Riptortus pedestris TaxID=329032 RepID=R4WTP6_RIPPE|nr:unknown secreted protein [Riptortus pedestris]